MNVLRALSLWTVLMASAGAFAERGGLDEINAMIDTGDLREAERQLDAILAANPEDVGGRFLKGVLLAEQERTDQAIQVFIELTEDYPHLPEPYNNLAALYAEKGDYPLAVEALGEAIRNNPGYAMAYENLGDVYAKMAAMAYDQALAIDRQNRSTQSKLAWITGLLSGDMGEPVADGQAGPEVDTKPTAEIGESIPVALPSPEPPGSDLDAPIASESAAAPDQGDTGTGPAQPEQTRDPIPMLKVKADVLNVRDGPGTQWQILRTVQRGQQLKEVAREGKWVQVREVETDRLGWVYSVYVGDEAPRN